MRKTGMGIPEYLKDTHKKDIIANLQVERI